MVQSFGRSLAQDGTLIYPRMEMQMTRTALFLAVALMFGETAGAQSLRTSTLGVTSTSCVSCDVPPLPSWHATPFRADSSGDRHLMRVAGLTVAGAALGAFAGVIRESGRPDCSGDICGFRQSMVNQSALFGALLGTVTGFSIGMLVWGMRSY